jgi:hypothetical protein
MKQINPEVAKAIIAANDALEPFENEYKQRPVPFSYTGWAIRFERERCIEVIRHRIELLQKAAPKKFASEIGELELLIVNIISTGDGNGFIE